VYNFAMNRRARPPKSAEHKRAQPLDLRLRAAEKQAFRLTAESSDQDLPVWIRVQLHRAASEETNGSKPQAPT